MGTKVTMVDKQMSEQKRQQVEREEIKTEAKREAELNDIRKERREKSYSPSLGPESI